MSTFQESGLGPRDNRIHHLRKSHRQDLRKNFIETTKERDWAVFFHSHRRFNLRDQGDKVGKKAIGKLFINIELIKHNTYLMLQEIPKLLKEGKIKAVGARTFITITCLHHRFNFLQRSNIGICIGHAST